MNPHRGGTALSVNNSNDMILGGVGVAWDTMHLLAWERLLQKRSPLCYGHLIDNLDKEVVIRDVVQQRAVEFHQLVGFVKQIPRWRQMVLAVLYDFAKIRSLSRPQGRASLAGRYRQVQ